MQVHGNHFASTEKILLAHKAVDWNLSPPITFFPSILTPKRQDLVALEIRIDLKLKEILGTLQILWARNVAVTIQQSKHYPDTCS